jgi:predicted Zn-dependent protease
MKHSPKKIILLVVLSIALGLGCTTMYNSATGRNEFIMISTTEEVQMGQSIHQTISSQNRVSTDRELVSRINKIGQRLARISDRQDYTYNFFVIESKELNAFTTPGGNIYIYTGLLEKLQTEDQIAFVLAHEMGHCAARHTTKKFQAALGYNLIGNILLSRVQEGSMRQVASLSSGAIMSLVFSAYGRHDEYEADRLGVKYLYLAGYEPQGAIDSLGVLQREMQNDRKIPLILRSHPYLDDRVEAVKKEIANGQSKFSKKT